MTENHLFLLNNKNRVEFKDALDIMQFVDVRDFKIHSEANRDTMLLK